MQRRQDFPHDDAFMVTLDVGNFTIKRLLINNGSSIDISLLSILQEMGMDKSTFFETLKATLVLFDEMESRAIGTIKLPIIAT